MGSSIKGRQFGLLIALSRVKEGQRVKWLCQCRCGNQKTVREDSLLNGRTKSCGCARLQLKRAKAEKRFGLINQKFGKLVVLWRYKGPKGSTSRSMVWECRCDCGNIVKVTGTDLRAGIITNCGCALPSTEVVESGVDLLLDSYKKSADKREISWDLSREQFKRLVLGDCFYCGKQPKQINDSKPIYSGLDRVNNRVGYVEGNTVSCCSVHSRMKGTMNQSEFIAACQKVITYKEVMRK